jgi:hypothetical protein
VPAEAGGGARSMELRHANAQNTKRVLDCGSREQPERFANPKTNFPIHFFFGSFFGHNIFARQEDAFTITRSSAGRKVCFG